MIKKMYSTRENIKKSLKLAWQHKILWIFALLAISGSTGNFNSSISEPLQKVDQQNKQNTPQQNEDQGQKMSYTFSPGDNTSSNQFKAVLGAQDAANTPNLWETFYNDLGKQNLTLPAILVGLSFAIFIGYMIVVGFLLKGWSKSALLAGTFKGLQEKDLNLKNLGRVGRANMVRFIKVEILTALLAFLLLIVTLGITGLAFFIAGLTPGLSIILYIVAVLTFIAGLIFMGFVAAGLIFSLRKVLTSDISTKEAVKFGVKTLLGNFWNYFKLIIVSILIFIVSLISVALIFALVGGLLYLLYTVDKGNSFNRLLVILSGMVSVPLVLGAGIALEILWGYFRTFFEFTYTNLYLHSQNIDDARTVKLMGETNGN
jgi:hypothetical protein